jgi:hypothetical protein
MTTLTRDQEWPPLGMAVYAAIHRRSGLATVQVAMDKPRMTVDTSHSHGDMCGVRDPMLAHDIAQLGQGMAMEAGLIVDLGADQWTGFLPRDHDIEIPRTVHVGLQLSPPSGV